MRGSGVKLSIGKEALLGAVSTVAEATPKRSSNPALEHVRLQAANGALTLSGGDGTVSALVTVPCDVASPGEVAILATDLQRIASAIPDGNVDLREENLSTHITGSGKVRFTCHGIHPGEMPNLGTFPSEGVEVASELLLAALASVKHAANTGADRAHLCGIRCRILGGEFEAIAVTGHTGAVYHREVDVDAPAFDVFIPTRAFALIHGVCSSNEKVKLHDDGACLFVSTPSESHKYSLPPNALPWSIASVIADTPAKSVAVNPDELAAAIRMVSVVREEQGESKKGILEPLMLTVSNGSLGVEFRRAHTSVDCSGDVGKKATQIYVEAKYLLEALRVCSGETLFHFGDPTRDYLELRSGNVRAIVLPMRV
jgi:DNA polymerase III sliding clamp (beta) subunit (PCNA family)